MDGELAPGTVTAQCLDASGNAVSGATDSRTTAGPENKIVLTVVSELTKPDGTSFQWTSNGSDAAFVVAEVQNAQGNLVPTAADNVTFSISGPATYMGGTQQLVADPAVSAYYQDAFSKTNSTVINGLPYAFFHSPGDPELNFEGGLQKIALRSTFAPGTVTVTASAPGLAGGSVQLTSVAPPAPAQSQAPAIIVPPVDQSVTAGFPATYSVAASGSGTLAYQWYVNGTAVGGATGTSYSTPTTSLSDSGKTISVTVTSGFGAVTSNPAKLTVSAPANVVITAQPAPQTVVLGQSATFTVAATGSPQLNYQWFVNGAVVANGPRNTTPPRSRNARRVERLRGDRQSVEHGAILYRRINSWRSRTGRHRHAAAKPDRTRQSAGAVERRSHRLRPVTYTWQFTSKGGSPTILFSNTQLSPTITYTLPAMSVSGVGAYTVTVNNAANTPSPARQHNSRSRLRGSTSRSIALPPPAARRARAPTPPPRLPSVG